MEAFITRRGGTGGGLNFSVVGGTTQPENPKENTIWVNTDQEITGWTFAAFEPDEMQEGGVCFILGLSSEGAFCPVEDKKIVLYPIEAVQYTSGTWVQRLAFIYMDGEWKPIKPQDLVLYYAGADNTEVTGGWSKAQNNGTLTIGSSNMLIVGHDESPYYMYVASNRLIDLTGYTILRFQVKATSTAMYSYFGIGTARGSYAASTRVAMGTTVNTWFELDISGFDGLYYVEFSSGAWKAGLSVSRIELLAHREVSE